MNVNQFIDQYGFTEKRRHLIGLLKNELSVINEKGWSFRAYVFGSVVNSQKDEPNDIDCLLSINNAAMEGNWIPSNSSSELHFWPYSVRFDSSIFYANCRELGEMLNAFKQSNIKTGENIIISEEECVEIEL